MSKSVKARRLGHRRSRGVSWAAVLTALFLVLPLQSAGAAGGGHGGGREAHLGNWPVGPRSDALRQQMLKNRLANPHGKASTRNLRAAAGPAVDPIDLRVLVLATKGDPSPDGVHAVPAGSWDWDLSTLTSAMDYLGVPYDTYKSSTKQLCVGGTWKLDWAANPAATDTTCSSGKVTAWATGVLPAALWDGAQHAYYEAVMQTNGTLSYVDGTGAFVSSALTTTEWSSLWTFEAQFGIRTVSANTYPTADFGLTYKSEDGNATTATWTTAGAAAFPYVKAPGALPIANAYTYRASASPTDTTTSVVLTDAANDALGVIHTYTAQGNRQALALTFDSAGYLTHGQVLGYGLVSWATKGLFLGERHAYMDPQPDDLFISDSIWQGPGDPKPTPCGTLPDASSLPQYRITGADFTAFTNWQTATQAVPLTKSFQVEWPFNGEGTTADFYNSIGITTDTLTPVVKANQAKYKFVSHTYDHQNLDARNVAVTVTKSGTTTFLTAPGGQFVNSWGHTVIATGVPAGTVVSNVSTDGNTVTLSNATTMALGSTTVWMGVTYVQTTSEIQTNASVSTQLGLTTRNPSDLVQPDISGLTNQNFLQSAYDHGVRYLISDTSRTGDPHTYGANEGVVSSGTYNKTQPGATTASGNTWKIYTLARTAVNLYFNVNTPARWLAEDQCLYPAGTFGHVDTYSALLDRVSDQLASYLLQGQNRPLMFHQPNTAAYDGTHSLLGDLMDRTFAKYGALVTVPLASPTMDTLGLRQSDKEDYDQALLAGSITASTVPGVSVTLTNKGTTLVKIPVTGVNAGTAYKAEKYAGQWISYASLNPGASITWPLT